MSRSLLIDNYDSYTYIIYQNIWKLSGIQPLLLKNDELDIDSDEAPSDEQERLPSEIDLDDGNIDIPEPAGSKP